MSQSQMPNADCQMPNKTRLTLKQKFRIFQIASTAQYHNRGLQKLRDELLDLIKAANPRFDPDVANGFIFSHCAGDLIDVETFLKLNTEADDDHH